MNTNFSIESFLDLSNYATKTRVARRKTGKNTNEFFTPYSIVKRMGDKIPESDWADPTKTFLEPGFGNGGNKIECDDLSAHKFDICMMNPPYSGGIHERFLYKVLQVSKNLVTIQPDSYLFKGKNGNEKIKNILNDNNTDIEIIDANKFFGTYMQQRIGILLYKESDTSKILYNGKKLNTLNNIHFREGDDLILKFESQIKDLLKDNCGEKWKGTSGSHYPVRIVDNDKENPECYIVNCSLLRGHPNTNRPEGKDADFYTMIPSNEKLLNSNFIGKYKDIIKQTYSNKNKTKLQYYYKFDTENEARNFINYLKTDFARACLYLKKKDMNIPWGNIPWFDFSQDIFSKSPREIDDYLFNKYKISDEIRNHIEEILPDYYNIRS